MPFENNQQITLKAGETTTINLKGLGTAGYEWNYTLDNNKNLVTISKDFKLTDKVKRKNIGSSADEVFTIKAHNKGTVTILFFQKRDWETNVAPVNEKKVTIIID